MNGKSKSQATSRLAFTLCCLVGKRVVAELTDGRKIEGVLTGAQLENDVAFKGCSLRFARVIEPAGDSTIHPTMNLVWEDTVSVFAKDAGGLIQEIEMAKSGRVSSAGQGFTDQDISSQRADNKERADRRLQAVDNSWVADTEGLDMSEGGGNWDQFETNRKLFGVKSTYDESFYTTKLDKSRVSEADKRRAEELARAIETKSSNNIHVLEERGQIPLSEGRDDDEELLYSSVIRSDNPNAYQPPHRRESKPQASQAPAPTPSKGASSKPKPPPSTQEKSKGDKSQKQQHAQEKPQEDKPKHPPGMSWAARVKGPGSEEDKATEKPAASTAVPPTQQEQSETPRGKPRTMSVERQRQIEEMKQFSKTISSKVSSSKSGESESTVPVSETKKVAEPTATNTSTAPTAPTAEKKVSKMNVNAKEWKPKSTTPEYGAMPTYSPVMTGQPPMMPPAAPQMYMPGYGYPMQMYPMQMYHQPPPYAGHIYFDPNNPPPPHHHMPPHPPMEQTPPDQQNPSHPQSN